MTLKQVGLLFGCVAIGGGCSLPKISEASCSAGQILVSNGSGWTCMTMVEAMGAMGATGSTGAVGTTGAKGPVALPTCGANQYVTSDGTSLTCVDFSAVSYACPPGYTAATDVVSSFCQKTLAGGQTDEMVKVGDFWIDRFEMSGSIGAAGSCGANSNGQPDGYGTTAIGCSVSGVQPVASITWFQAVQMCANAGKSLCTNVEWQTAASGTVDPGAYPETDTSSCTSVGTPGQGPCNTCSDGPRNTGLGGAASPEAGCYSSYGAQDMIGNVWEWTGEWWQTGQWNGTSPAFSTDQQSVWPSGYGDGDDAIWNLNGSSQTSYAGAFTNGLPAATMRGGDWFGGSHSGAFAVFLGNGPTVVGTDHGARCCTGGR